MSIPFQRRPTAGVRPSPVFLAVLALTVASAVFVYNAGTVTTSVRVGAFVFIMAAWVLTLCLHEFAHAFLAWRFGDHEVEARGYLTLNPFKYSHPVLSIVLPVAFIAMGGIGLPGGAVYLHPQQFRSRGQRAAVSLAGPAVNAVCAVLLLASARTIGLQSDHRLFWYAVSFLAVLQIMATVLNLLPVPGLDGYGVIEAYLDPQFQRSAEQFKPFGLLAVFALLQFPSINRAFFNAIYSLFETSGLSRIAADLGYLLMKFWQPL
jgi:Zn-dependent protease